MKPFDLDAAAAASAKDIFNSTENGVFKRSKTMSIAQNQALALAKQFNIQGDTAELVTTLKATAFKGNVTDAQFNALLIVATKYNLDPFTSEIYAFPSNGGIVPVVGSVIEPISNWHDSAIPTTQAAD